MPDNKPPRGTYEYNKEYAKAYRAQFALIQLRMHPDKKEEITAAARVAGESVNYYIMTAIQNRMDSEQPTTPDK